MKIRHVRDLEGRPFATIVQDNNGCFGVSICNSKDNFNKKLGVKIASGRARYGTMPDFPHREETVALLKSEDSYDLSVMQVKDYISYQMGLMNQTLVTQ